MIQGRHRAPSVARVGLPITRFATGLRFLVSRGCHSSSRVLKGANRTTDLGRLNVSSRLQIRHAIELSIKVALSCSALVVVPGTTVDTCVLASSGVASLPAELAATPKVAVGNSWYRGTHTINCERTYAFTIGYQGSSRFLL